MGQVIRSDSLSSTKIRGRFGKPRAYGRAVFGQSDYGADDIFLIFHPDGVTTPRPNDEDVLIELSGIWQERRTSMGSVNVRLPYYIPKNPQSGDQITQRNKLAAGVAAWQALSADDKMDYNEKAFGLNMSGYNLFLHDYLLI
jgi:hypothetical protein